MRVDRSQSGEYASLKRIRITHDVHMESLVLFSMISVNTHHASRITLHASRVCGVVALRTQTEETAFLESHRTDARRPGSKPNAEPRFYSGV